MKNPCWDGYKAIGTKDKGGRKVPNCVLKSSNNSKSETNNYSELRVPEGWKVKNFSVKLKPGKPDGATEWQDVSGRPVVKSGRTWALKQTKGEPGANNQKAKSAEVSNKAAQQSTPIFRLNEEQQEEVKEAKRKFSDRIENRLGKSPFDAELDTTTDKYRDNIDRMRPYAGMSDNQKAALNLYGQDGKQYYAMINKQLRTNSEEGLTPEDLEMSKFIQENLTEVLSALPPRNGEVYRAVSGVGADQLANLKPGDVYEDRGFGSYSDNQRSVGMFVKRDRSNAVLTVKSSTARNVSPVMEYEEGEHLSLPGTKYKLVDVTSYYSGRLKKDIPHYIFEEVK